MGFFVDVCHAIFTSTIRIAAALKRFSSKGDAVVIDAKGLLVVSSCRPPARSIGTSLSAAHVTRFLIVNAPRLTGNQAEILRVVNLRLVKGIGFLHATLAESVAVAKFQLYGMCACLRVFVAYFGQRRIGSSIKYPEWIGAWLGSIVGHHLVGFLVNGDLKVHTVNCWYAVGVSTVEAIG